MSQEISILIAFILELARARSLPVALRSRVLCGCIWRDVRLRLASVRTNEETKSLHVPNPEIARCSTLQPPTGTVADRSVNTTSCSQVSDVLCNCPIRENKARVLTREVSAGFSGAYGMEGQYSYLSVKVREEAGAPDGLWT